MASEELVALKRDNNRLKALFKSKQKIVEEYNLLHNFWRDFLKEVPQGVESVNMAYERFKVQYEYIITDFRQICTEFNISMNSIQEALNRSKEEKSVSD